MLGKKNDLDNVLSVPDQAHTKKIPQMTDKGANSCPCPTSHPCQKKWHPKAVIVNITHNLWSQKSFNILLNTASTRY